MQNLLSKAAKGLVYQKECNTFGEIWKYDFDAFHFSAQATPLRKLKSEGQIFRQYPI